MVVVRCLAAAGDRLGLTRCGGDAGERPGNRNLCDLEQWEVSDVLPGVKQMTGSVFRVLQKRRLPEWMGSGDREDSKPGFSAQRKAQRILPRVRGKEAHTRKGDLPGNRSEKCAF